METSFQRSTTVVVVDAPESKERQNSAMVSDQDAYIRQVVVSPGVAAIPATFPLAIVQHQSLATVRVSPVVPNQPHDTPRVVSGFELDDGDAFMLHAVLRERLISPMLSNEREHCVQTDEHAVRRGPSHREVA